MRIVVVGATGAVGSAMLAILEERDLGRAEVVVVASARSAGRKIRFRDRRLKVTELAEDVFAPGDLALFDVPDEVSERWAPVAAGRGAMVVDNSAAFRMDPEVPLVVPEINPGEVDRASKRIIASPNCTTLAAVVPLAALHNHVPIRRVIASSYQAVSGSGKAGVDELWDQTEIVVKERDAVQSGTGRDVLTAGTNYVEPIAMNVVPLCGSLRDEGYTSEELKLCRETRKIMGLPELRVTATCVRVPVMVGHAVSVHAEFERAISAEQARDILVAAPGVEVRDSPDEGVLPTPLHAAGRNPCFVGRIRQDLFDRRALELFCVADNLRKGAALNTVQIAELLV